MMYLALFAASLSFWAVTASISTTAAASIALLSIAGIAFIAATDTPRG